MGNNPSNLNRTSYYSVEYLNGTGIGGERQLGSVGNLNSKSRNDLVNDAIISGQTFDVGFGGGEYLEENESDDEELDNETSKTLDSSDYLMDNITVNTSINNKTDLQNDEIEDYETLDFYESKEVEEKLKMKSSKSIINDEEEEEEEAGFFDRDLNFSSDGINNVGQRLKSYVKPENRVLPCELPSKPLRETNLLKIDGFKRTWRNKPTTTLRKKSNSILIGNDVFNLDSQ